MSLAGVHALVFLLLIQNIYEWLCYDVQDNLL